MSTPAYLTPETQYLRTARARHARLLDDNNVNRKPRSWAYQCSDSKAVVWRTLIGHDPSCNCGASLEPATAQSLIGEHRVRALITGQIAASNEIAEPDLPFAHPYQVSPNTLGLTLAEQFYLKNHPWGPLPTPRPATGYLGCRPEFSPLYGHHACRLLDALLVIGVPLAYVRQHSTCATPETIHLAAGPVLRSTHQRMSWIKEIGIEYFDSAADLSLNTPSQHWGNLDQLSDAKLIRVAGEIAKKSGFYESIQARRPVEPLFPLLAARLARAKSKPARRRNTAKSKVPASA